jgi:predicted transcriptional regulator
MAHDMAVDPDTGIADLVVTSPTVHGPGATVGELRALFLDEHMHMALLVEQGRLIAAVERDDLRPELADDMAARCLGTIRGRTVHAEASIADALATMQESGRRRLAVTDSQGTLVGLLCLKESGRGFCSDEGVASRRLGSAA